MITESEAILIKMNEILDMLRKAKPSERNEVARRYSITITEFEKIEAYFEKAVVDYVKEK